MPERANRYFTGKPCPSGHVAERYASTRACVRCMAEKAAAWKLANPEKHAEQHRNWIKANPERARELKLAEQKRNRAQANERNRRYRESNLEKTRAATKAWALANPGKCTAKSNRYRASLLRATPGWANHELIAAYYELASVYREHAGLDVEVDHIVPLQGKKVCGFHVHDNLQIIKSLANKSKSNHFASL